MAWDELLGWLAGRGAGLEERVFAGVSGEGGADGQGGERFRGRLGALRHRYREGVSWADAGLVCLRWRHRWRLAGGLLGPARAARVARWRDALPSKEPDCPVVLIRLLRRQPSLKQFPRLVQILWHLGWVASDFEHQYTLIPYLP